MILIELFLLTGCGGSSGSGESQSVAASKITFTTTGTETSESGTSVSASVALKSEPRGDVTVKIASSDTTEATVSAGQFTFTTSNWASSQTATITAVNDNEDDGDITYKITISPLESIDSNYNGYDPDDVSLVNLDNDEASTTSTSKGTITISSISGNTTESGGTATFAIALDSRPSADVTIGLSSSDTTEGTVSPTSLTFTSSNWNSSQTITVTGVDDSLSDGSITYSIFTASASSTDSKYNGVNFSDISVVNTDDDSGVAFRAFVKASNNANGRSSDNFGNSTAIYNNTLVVGAPSERSNQNTITNGATSSANTDSNGAGAVYVYKKTGSTWAQEAYIKAPNAEESDGFGNRVAIYEDTIAVSAPYEDNTQATITNGSSISDTGTANQVGAVYIFKRTSNSWAFQSYLKVPNPVALLRFGTTSLSLYKDTLAVGVEFESSNEYSIINGGGASTNNDDTSAGAVYVFKRASDNWSLQSYLKANNGGANDRFGIDVSVYEDTLAVGAMYEDSS